MNSVVDPGPMTAPGGDTSWVLHGMCVGEASQVADEATEEGSAAVAVCVKAA